MTDDQIPTGEEPTFAAAEYVLGLTDAPERAAAERRVLTDADFRAAVAFWEDRFAPLFDQVTPVTADPGLWDRIAARMGGEAAAAPDIANDNMTGVAPWWRGYGIGMTGLAAVLLGLLVIPRQATDVVQTPAPPVVLPDPPPPPPVQLLSARVAPEEGVPVAIITYLPSENRLYVSPFVVDASAENSPQLWFIPEGGAPRSLGLISQDSPSMVEVPADFTSADTLAISIEPLGGSPTGAPTGPIVGTGALDTL